ncbi:WD40 repeat-like protein, partial [Hortaea werneckii]
SVTVILEENTCFDAEMYADELDFDEDIEFRDDQRINLGKWVLRYLFSNLITEEIKRDEAHRKQLMSSKEQQKLQRENAPTSIQLPQAPTYGWQPSGPSSATTLKAGNGTAKPQTPGFNIGMATPAINNSPAQPAPTSNPRSSTADDGGPLEKRTSRQSGSHSRPSTDRNSDYFSSSRATSSEATTPGGTSKQPSTPGENGDEATTPSGDAAQKDAPSKTGLFGKKFRMGMSFSGMKTMAKTSTNDSNKDKPTVVEEKDESQSDSQSSKTSNSREVQENLQGTVQKIRFGYEDSLQAQIQNQQAYENGLPVAAPTTIDLPSAITPSLPAETPVLKPPPNTTILIQEDRPEAGGVADLFEGTVSSLGEQCDQLERSAPMWLAEVLLR